MAPNMSYVVSSDNEHDDYAESSPDPLAVSHNENRVRARPTVTTRATNKQPLTTTSPSKQNRRSNISEFDLSSPTKQMMLSTPRTGGQSPWRIKVTVQAEPGSDSENIESPIVKHVTHTKTTKIPLKDADASSPVKRRGRPRKSEATTKRSGTPVRKRATSKARRLSVGDTSAADIETDATPKRKRGRPRKSAQPAEDDIWGQVRGSGVEVDAKAANIETDATPKRKRGRPRKSIQPPVEDKSLPVVEEPAPARISASRVASEPRVETPPTPSFGDSSSSTEVIEQSLPTPQILNTTLRSTPPQRDLSRKLKKGRKNTPVASDKILVEISSGESSDDESDEHQVFEIEEAVNELETSEAPLVEEGEDNGHYETHFAFDEGTTRMPDDTTIIDSESFSMISVDSLPRGGALTSPANVSIGNTPHAPNQTSIRSNTYLGISSTNRHGSGDSSTGARSSPAPSRSVQLLPQKPHKSSPPAAPTRYKTPSIEPVELSNPPPVEPAQLFPTEAQTPKIGRVVKAGVALQGVLDPNRVTPEVGPPKAEDDRRGHLDDLFRGFSDRTRKELHAGLRLGEQLAQQNQPSSPALSSPIKTVSSHHATEHYLAPRTTAQQLRLLTPEDQDDDTVQPAEVHYPSLPGNNHESHLLSPISNPENEGNEMSWRVDTPPVTGELQRFADNFTNCESVTKEDAPDIWQEEASRASAVSERSNNSTEGAPRVQDIFFEEGHIKPARGKIPGTWRWKTSDDFHYSDGAEESQMETPLSTESDDSPAQKVYKGKSKVIEPPVTKEREEDCNEDSDGSDDTGMFFQSNMPNLFSKKRSSEFRRRRAEKIDLTPLLDQSLLPESSPPAAQTPAMDKQNPFLNTPPQLAALNSSPVKSSPLRQELRGSDISSESLQPTFEESTLPLAPSSPFHTFVEGDTARSMASGQRQLMRQMVETDSSLNRIRHEADEYLDAYEPQVRSLHDLTEITEPSKTWHKDTMLASSPPKQTFAKSITNANRTRTPLFEDGSPSKKSIYTTMSQAESVPAPVSSNKAPIPATSRITEKEPAAGSITSSHLSSPVSSEIRSIPPPLHPTLSNLDHLPRVEPWTKTHYKALDRLYQLYKKQPHIFSPSHSALNTTLLTEFLNITTHRYIGVRYRAWGYSVILNESLIILCAAYTQLLTLDGIDEYERVTGKEIQIGECGPGVIGERITAEKVVERLATVVLGEAVRREEKKGGKVDRSGRLRAEWPQ